MAKLTVKDIKANNGVACSLDIVNDACKPSRCRIVRTSDLPSGIVKTKAEPWMHTAICVVDSIYTSASTGSNHTIVGCLLVTYIWDTRKVLEVQKLDRSAVDKLSTEEPFYYYKRKHFTLFDIKPANDNGEPLDGIAMSQIYDMLKKYAKSFIKSNGKDAKF